jgi:hypothetical protein
MANNVFGIEEAPPEDLLGLTETTPEDAEAPTEEAPPVDETAAAPEQEPEPETQEEATTEDAPEEDAETPVAEETTVEEEVARRWANKYDSPEALEQGYNESREQWRRAVEARKAEEQRAAYAEAQYLQLQAALQQVVPTLQQAAQREVQYHNWARQYAEQTGSWPEGYTPPQAPPPVGTQDVNTIIEQRLAQEREAMAAQVAQQQEYQQLEGAVLGFYQDHPEVEPYGPLDNEITDAMTTLNESWSDTGTEVDPSDRGSLEVLYEAAQRPALLAVLQMKPQYFESDYGLQLARMEASVLEGAPATTQPQTRAVAASQVGQTAGRQKPFAESASVGAAAPAAEELSEWDEIVASVRGSRSGKKDVFFGE